MIQHNRRRLLQFGLGTLIALTVLAAVFFWVYSRNLRVGQARKSLILATRACNAGRVPCEEVVRASLALLSAQASVPFADRRAAAQDHLDRVEKLRTWQLNFLSLGPGKQELEAQAAKTISELDGHIAEAKVLLEAESGE